MSTPEKERALRQAIAAAKKADQDAEEEALLQRHTASGLFRLHPAAAVPLIADYLSLVAIANELTAEEITKKLLPDIEMYMEVRENMRDGKGEDKH